MVVHVLFELEQAYKCRIVSNLLGWFWSIFVQWVDVIASVLADLIIHDT